MLLGATLAAVACGLFPSLEGLSGGVDATTDAASEAPALDAPSESASDASDGGASVDASDGACVSAHGPPMVRIPVGDFCIDSTEVTNTDYAAFVDAVSKGATIATPPNGACAWNTSIAPLSSTQLCTPDTTDASAHPTRPVSCVNWCDAYAYCAWAGKRLCGAIDGGVLDFANVINPQNQSFVACSVNATQAFPYGAAYVKGNCNTKDLYDASPGIPADVKSFAQCVGGYPGIYDLTGNVEEWSDSCQSADGSADYCHEFGDCFDYTATGPSRCDNADYDQRSARGPDVGIRCCSP